MAAAMGHLPVVRRLLRASADAEASNNDGATALMLATYAHKESVVRALLQHGARLGAAVRRAQGYCAGRRPASGAARRADRLAAPRVGMGGQPTAASAANAAPSRRARCPPPPRRRRPPPAPAAVAHAPPPATTASHRLRLPPPPPPPHPPPVPSASAANGSRLSPLAMAMASSASSSSPSTRHWCAARRPHDPRLRARPRPPALAPSPPSPPSSSPPPSSSAAAEPLPSERGGRDDMGNRVRAATTSAAMWRLGGSDAAAREHASRSLRNPMAMMDGVSYAEMGQREAGQHQQRKRFETGATPPAACRRRRRRPPPTPPPPAAPHALLPPLLRRSSPRGRSAHASSPTPPAAERATTDGNLAERSAASRDCAACSTPRAPCR